jgi:hypothetical protein
MRKLWALCFAAAISASNPASAINTYKKWDGSSAVFAFGCTDAATTYGQVITIPQGRHVLTKFSFWWSRLPRDKGLLVVRGEVYAWDGGRATGDALYESKRRTVSFVGHRFHKEVFSPTGLTVTPGAKYVIFASIDKDYEECSQNYRIRWGAIYPSHSPKGQFVYQFNAGDESRWTNSQWLTAPRYDLAFIATVRP